MNEVCLWRLPDNSTVWSQTPPDPDAVIIQSIKDTEELMAIWLWRLPDNSEVWSLTKPDPSAVVIQTIKQGEFKAWPDPPS